MIRILGILILVTSLLFIAFLIDDYISYEYTRFSTMFGLVSFLCVSALGGSLLIVGQREKDSLSPYAGFWPRFSAALLDAAIFIPIYRLFGNLAYQNSKFIIAVFLFLSFIAVNFLSIYLLTKFGGTPGKLLMGLRVKKLSFEKIGWKEAWLRFVVDLVILGALFFFHVLILHKIELREFSELSYLQRANLYYEKSYFWLPFIDIIYTLWISSEGVVLLLNKRKRAIHDFIAGTVVVKHKML